MNASVVILLSVLTIVLLGNACNSDNLSSDSISTTLDETYSGFLLASDFAIGDNRFPFAILSADGKPLKAHEIKARFFSVNNGKVEFVQEAIAEYLTISHTNLHQHIDGTIHLHENDRGFYVIDSISFVLVL